VRISLAVLFLVSYLSISNSAHPQSPNGSISGVVLDPDAKSMPGAEVIVLNDLTGVRYLASTNNEGIYAVPNLPPGSYRMQVSKVGFKSIIKPDIVLNVQDALSINFTLPIGASSVVVTVEGGAPLINTTDASVSTVVDRQFAENLPMNGRSFQSLIQLAPGVVVTPSNAADGGQFSVNGQRAASNYWVVDGVSANIGIGTSQQSPGNGFGGALGSFSAVGGTNSLVSVDAMQEFRIQTSTYAPEFGRTPGGQISILTRSGTNQFHGTAFDYVRNGMFDTNNWFADSVGLAKPEERQNDFGGTLSGPIFKDKTFFFFSYEGLRLRLPTTTLSFVPDLGARQNAVPALRPYLNAFPLPTPNTPDDKANGIAQFNASYSNPASLDAYSLRIDHKLSTRWNLFGRYNYSPSEFTERGTNTETGSLNSVQSNRITTQTATVGATWAISPTMANDLRFNYSRTSAEGHLTMDNFGGAVPLTALPFPSPFSTQTGLFDFSILSLGVGDLLETGQSTRGIQRQINVVDGLSVQKKAHSLKFGIDFRRLSPALDFPAYLQNVRFLSVPASETGASFVSQVASNNASTVLFRNLGIFAQDTWRVASRLTLTYGLRWDVDFTPSSLNGPNIPAVTGDSFTDFSRLAVAPLGTPPFRTTYDNVAPRLGVAYQICRSHDWQAVLRGGFGVFYDLVSSEAGNVFGFRAPPLGNFNNILFAPFPFTSAQIAPVLVPPTATLSNIGAFNPSLKLPYTLEWNVAFGQAIGTQQTVSASYVGAAGRRLLQTTIVQSPLTNPNVQLGQFVDNTASSDYNALQLQFERRLSRALQALASYTWSHSIDDGSAGSFANASNDSAAGNNNQNRGPSDFDIRQSFTAGLTYDIPARQMNSVAAFILHHWSIQSFVLARSAPPVDISDSDFSGLFNSGTFGNIRPDLVVGQPLYVFGSHHPGGKAFNPAAFTDPPVDPVTGNPTRQGNLGRNALRGFGATQWDFAVHRDFPIHESLKLQFRAEMFNVLNHPNFGPPNSQFPGAAFGAASQTLAQSLSVQSLGGGGFSPLYQIGGPRSIQFAVKLFF
jgi:hypothetical protein